MGRIPQCIETANDLIERSPVAALGLVVAIGAGAYAVVSFVMRQTVEPVEVGLFAVAFTAVYAAVAVYSDAIEGYLGAE